MVETKIPTPLFPPAEVRPLVTKTGGRFSIWNGDVWMGYWDDLNTAMNVAREEASAAILTTEYVQRRDKLARFLCDLVYGEGAWIEADHDLILNYRLDADDIIKANPHLLSLAERERLEHLIPELAL